MHAYPHVCDYFLTQGRKLVVEKYTVYVEKLKGIPCEFLDKFGKEHEDLGEEIIQHMFGHYKNMLLRKNSTSFEC